jgi:gliding motility-associated lipoprotein GldD
MTPVFPPRYINVLLLVANLMACRSPQKAEHTPKPKGYNRIDLAQPTYQAMRESHPYAFEYSQLAVIKKDTFAQAEPHWIFVHYPQFQASVQLTYKPLHQDTKRLEGLIADAHKLAAKHNIKAYAVTEKLYRTPSGKVAATFDLEGEVPSQFQFYITDSTQHYLRGALYFKTALHNDSLAPVIQYIRRDMVHLLNTLQWKK